MSDFITVCRMKSGACGSALIHLVETARRGHGALLRHHQFVWPAFALMTGLATGRILTRKLAETAPAPIYLALMFLGAALVSGAGYWRGELLNGG